jgi:thiol:disulfide interchange protein/DsbC/DsbD-like thiol-disulfide interchange protein
MKRSLCFPLLALSFAFAAPLAKAQVKVSLVAANASIQPGRSFTVALHLVHQPKWHTYWLNPGTGLATTIKWKLPPGWKAGDIQWPAPEVLNDGSGNIIGNGYEGDVLLPVTLTPPDDLQPGASVELQAGVEWLMCKDECRPGKAVVSLTLPVSAGQPARDKHWDARIRAVLAGLPGNDERWTEAASRDSKNVILAVVPKSAGAHVPIDLHFFSEDGLVAYDQPQDAKSDGRGGWLLTLPIAADGPTAATRLVGVLTSGNGWRTDGSLRGLRIDLPFGEAAEVAAQINPSASAETPPAPAAGGGLAGTLVLAFVGGLILNLMPCVFPVLGIKILGFVNQAGSERSKVVAHGLVFSSGVLVSFWTLAAVLAVLRTGGAQLGWGFQLQSPAFVFALAGIMLAFALNMSGVFEFGLGATGVGSELQSKSGYAGSFFTGMLATLVATPCSAPFLAPALGAALTLSTAESFLVFTTIAIGLSTPYLLLSIFPGAIKALPRPGAWMETFKQLMAFPLYATVGYLVWVLAGQVSESGLLALMIGLVLIAMGLWIYGRWRAPGASAGRARFGLVAGAALIALGAWNGWPRPPEPMEVAWEKWSPETVDALRSQGRIVYIDFTARWCATCQANKRVVFHSADVLKTFQDENIATLRADWTNKDPQITAELAKYHRSAVPFDLIWLPGRDNPVLLPELLTPGIVLKALKD